MAEVWAGIASNNGIVRSVASMLTVFNDLQQTNDTLNQRVATVLQILLLSMPVSGQMRHDVMQLVVAAIDAYVLEYLQCLKNEMSVGPDTLKSGCQRHMSYMLTMLIAVEGIEAIPALRAAATHDLLEWPNCGDWGEVMFCFGLPSDLPVDAALVRRSSILRQSRLQRVRLDLNTFLQPSPSLSKSK